MPDTLLEYHFVLYNLIYVSGRKSEHLTSFYTNFVSPSKKKNREEIKDEKSLLSVYLFCGKVIICFTFLFIHSFIF